MSAQQHHHRQHHHHKTSSIEKIQTKAGEDGPIRLRAYEIYCEKGGYALDNWLEAELTLKK